MNRFIAELEKIAASVPLAQRTSDQLMKLDSGIMNRYMRSIGNVFKKPSIANFKRNAKYHEFLRRINKVENKNFTNEDWLKAVASR